MRKSIASALSVKGIPIANRSVTNVLSISPIPDDHIFLENCLAGFTVSAQDQESGFALRRTFTLASALPFLREVPAPPIVFCERELSTGTWKELLKEVVLLPEPPSLIVTASSSDPHFWADALDRGAYYVLAKPFDESELLHVVTAAWLHWVGQQELKKQRLRDSWAVEQWNAMAG